MNMKKALGIGALVIGLGVTALTNDNSPLKFKSNVATGKGYSLMYRDAAPGLTDDTGDYQRVCVDHSSGSNYKSIDGDISHFPDTCKKLHSDFEFPYSVAVADPFFRNNNLYE